MEDNYTLTHAEAELILTALYLLLEDKEGAFKAVHAARQRIRSTSPGVPSFRPLDFAIPQIKALIAKLEGGDE